MGFSYNDISSKSMGLKARLTSWQVCGGMRNFYHHRTWKVWGDRVWG